MIYLKWGLTAALLQFAEWRVRYYSTVTHGQRLVWGRPYKPDCRRLTDALLDRSVRRKQLGEIWNV